MDMKQLEAFVAVVQHNSFSKAADTIYLTQPTISVHIGSLEKELGVQLLVRSAKGVYPTQKGKALFLRAKSILALRDDALAGLDRADEELSGEISILASTVPAQFLLPAIVADFQKKYQQVTFNIHRTDSKDVERLLDYRYDFGIVGTAISSLRMETTPLYRDTLVMVTPVSMRANKEEIYNDLVSFLQDKPFVMREEGSGTRVEMEQMLRRQGICNNDLHVTAYFDDTQSILSAVGHGMGVSFVSQAAARVYEKTGQIKVYEFEENTFSRQLYLVLKKEQVLSPIQDIFVTYLKEALAQ